MTGEGRTASDGAVCGRTHHPNPRGTHDPRFLTRDRTRHPATVEPDSGGLLEPDTSNASVTLTHQKGKLYTGVVDATTAGKRERVGVRVTHGRHTVSWELHPLRE